jgi:hypothetical protein
MTETIPFICRMCRKPRSVEFDRTGDFNFDAPAARLAETLVCDECADTKRARLAGERAATAKAWRERKAMKAAKRKEAKARRKKWGRWS